MAEFLGPALLQEQTAGAHLDDLRNRAAGCTRCPLQKRDADRLRRRSENSGTRIRRGATGDKEDLSGRPFVGPAGKLLDHCLDEAGIERSKCYLTNAVKHFKFEARGKRRIHAKPNRGEVKICAWWLGAELRLSQPKLVVALGATATYTLLGPQARVNRDRGSVLHAPGGLPVFITIHPSALLRMLNQPRQEEEIARFVDDLRSVVASLGH